MRGRRKAEIGIPLVGLVLAGALVMYDLYRSWTDGNADFAIGLALGAVYGAFSLHFAAAVRNGLKAAKQADDGAHQKKGVHGADGKHDDVRDPQG